MYSNFIIKQSFLILIHLCKDFTHIWRITVFKLFSMTCSAIYGQNVQTTIGQKLSIEIWRLFYRTKYIVICKKKESQCRLQMEFQSYCFENVFFLYSNSGGKRSICKAKIVFSSSNIKWCCVGQSCQFALNFCTKLNIILRIHL